MGLKGLMGLGIKMSFALSPVLAQSRAEEKTQDVQMPPTAEGHMALAMGAGSLTETAVGRSLEFQIKVLLNQGAPLWTMVREILVSRRNF